MRFWRHALSAIFVVLLFAGCAKLTTGDSSTALPTPSPAHSSSTLAAPPAPAVMDPITVTVTGTAPISISEQGLQIFGSFATESSLSVILTYPEGDQRFDLLLGQVLSRDEASYLLCGIDLIPQPKASPIPPGTPTFTAEISVSPPGGRPSC